MKRSILLALVVAALVVGVIGAQSTGRGRSFSTPQIEVTIKANVSNATVTIGKETLRAPAVFKLKPGEYDVTVQAPDHHAVSQKITVQQTKDNKAAFSFNLKPVLFKLTVLTNAKKAYVFVDRKDRGFTRPDKSRKEESLAINLRPGTYTVLVKSPGWQDFTARVNLRKDTVLEAMLKPAMARLTLPKKYLEGDVKFFKLYVDGKLLNAKMAVQGAIEIPPGEHTVVIASAPSGLRVEQVFDFEPGAEYVIELKMNFLYSER
jgi:hypothetical protein